MGTAHAIGMVEKFVDENEMMKSDKIFVFTDGGARGNPGPAAIGIMLYDEKKQLLLEHKECIGTATNNIAEYKALIKALELVVDFSQNEVCCFLDSELVVMQLNGRYRVKTPHIQKLFSDLKQREKMFKKVVYNHRRRTDPFISRCDSLVNNALDDVR
ncbi:MAG: ribonuclease HI family protein [Thermoplasmata archaeon]|nr:ribonuclease HI family protein [Thermoplasmata archaeon]